MLKESLLLIGLKTYIKKKALRILTAPLTLPPSVRSSAYIQILNNRGLVGADQKVCTFIRADLENCIKRNTLKNFSCFSLKQIQ